MEELLSWAETQGARLHSIRLSENNNRVFVAAEDIGEGATVISLPQSLLLHAELADADQEYGEAFRLLRQELGGQVDQRHMLCLLLILEKARAATSKWSTYVNILPTTYDDPYWWSTQEVQLVTGTRLSKAIEQYKPGLDLLQSSVARLEALHRLHSLDPASAGSVLTTYQGGWALTPAAARWARSTIWSRAFTVHQLAGRSSVVTLVPVLDMIDHSPDVEVVWHTGPSGLEDFQFATLTAVSKGSVMTNNYGSKTNDELLLAYGFLVEDNPADYFQVSLARGSQAPASSPSADPAAGPSASGGASPSGQQDGVIVGQQRAGLGSDGEAAGGAGDDGDEDRGGSSSELQQGSEELQRDVAMLVLGLEQQHRLSGAQPLPLSLVLSAQLALTPAPELYQLCAQLLQAAREQRREGAAGAEAEAEGSSAERMSGVSPAGGSLAGSAAQLEQLGKAEAEEAGAGGGADVQARKSADVLPSSAMHIVPRRRQGQGSSSPSGPEAEALAARTMKLLGGPGPSSSSSMPLPWLAKRLPALVAVQAQVEAKLQALVSERDARGLLALPPGVPSPLLPDGGGPAVSPHARLGLAYVRSQRSVLQASLLELRSQVSSTVAALSQHMQPEAPRGCAAFEVQPPAPVAEPSPTAPAARAALTATPAVFDADQAQHMLGYSRWLSQELATPEPSAPSVPSSSGRRGLGICEVLCQPRREALVAAASASRAAAAAASASGSRGGRRKPLSSLTLRSLRNISRSAARPGSAGQQAMAQQPQPTKSGEEEVGKAAPPQQKTVPSLPAGIASSLGLDMVLSYDSLAWGAQVLSPHDPGDIVLEVPLEHAVAADSRNELLEALMIRAHELLQELVANAAAHHKQQQQGGSGGAGAGAAAGPAAGQLQAQDMLVLHLMHVVGAPAASRLPASENERVSMLMEMLEDSPAGSECQEAFESLKAEHRQLSASVSACTHSNGGAAPSSSSSSGGGSGRLKAMRKVLTWPGAFGLYCWAVGVVERCAVRVDHGPPLGPGGPSGRWLVLPVVSAVPEPLRQAAFSLEAAGGAVRVRAACALPAGLLLSPVLLLPFGNVDQLVGRYGPEALAWRRLIELQHQGPAQPDKPSASDAGAAGAAGGGSPTGSGPGAAAPTGSGGAVNTEAYLQSLRATGPRVLYELYISPSEEDQLYQEKLELLAAAGLGCVHFLTEGLETKSLVLSALKICLADEELLMHPLVHQVIQLSQAMHMFKQKQQHQQQQVDATCPTAMAAPPKPTEAAAEDAAGGVAVAAAAAAGSDGAGGGGVPRGFLQLVQQGQQRLLGMLESLPAEHPVSAAAAKQLRSIVHDAHKHTKRRLRQMDTFEEQKQGGGGFWNAGGGGGQQQQQQGLQQGLQQQQQGLELLRQGVHLYLEELVLVLGAWASDLGLESKLEPACKRSKVEPSCKRPKLRHGSV